MKRASLLLAVCFAAAAVLTCSDSPTQSGESVQVSGTVRSYFCGVGDYWNNIGVELRYTLRTGISATVRFLDDRGREFDCLTDDSSSLAIVLHQGRYSAIVETGHAMPDTFFNITIAQDTSLDFATKYDWWTADTILAIFFYELADDSLGAVVEGNYLDFMQDKLNNMVNIRSARRDVYNCPFPPACAIVTYYVPIRKGLYMWHVVEAASKITEQYKEFFPDRFRFHPDGYICYV